jgi:hypothetical protein
LRFSQLKSALAGQSGSTYSFSEIRRGLETAGFKVVRLVQDGERMNGVVEAFKP